MGTDLLGNTWVKGLRTNFKSVTRAALTYSAMREQEGTIQLFVAVKCQKMDACEIMFAQYPTNDCN